MMTPEQLLNAWANCCDTRKAHDLLKQFQLDAYKAGMTRAAEILATYRSTEEISDAHHEVVTECDNLKELPNE